MAFRQLKLTIIGPLLISLLVVVVFGVAASVVWRTYTVVIEQWQISDGSATLSVTAKLLFNPLYNLDISTLNRTLRDFSGETNVIYAEVRDISGQVVAAAPGAWQLEEQIGLEMSQQALTQRDIVHQEIEGYLALCGPITIGTEQIGTLQLTFARDVFRRALATMRDTMIVLMTSLVVFTIFASSLLARQIIRPLQELTSVAQEIGRGNMDVQVMVGGPQEVAILAMGIEEMRVELRDLQRDLERELEMLELRTEQLEAAAEVAHEATIELNTSRLLSQVVTLISERFGFYHTAIFLLDSTGEWVKLEAASSEGGRRMLARGHQLRVGVQGIVGYAANRGEPRIALDVGVDKVFLNNPDLPDTRSEMALPMRARGNIIGVLDVQSDEPEAFNAEDVTVLQVLSDQVAVAIDNARLLEQAQQSAEAAREARGELSREAWQALLRTQSSFGFLGDAQGVSASGDFWEPQMSAALQRGERIVPESSESADTASSASIAIPIRVRGQVIGVVDALKPGQNRAWMPEELALLESLIEQLQIALEGARLYQESQRRAAREQMIGEVTGRIRETLHMETILRTATEQMRQALDLDDLIVRLVTPEDRPGNS